MIAACGSGVIYPGRGHGEIQGSYTITTNQIPSHSHTGPSHTHGVGTLATNSGGRHDHAVNVRVAGFRPSISSSATVRYGVSSDSSQWSSFSLGRAKQYEDNVESAHNHPLKGATAAAGTGNTGATGGGASYIPYSYSFHC